MEGVTTKVDIITSTDPEEMLQHLYTFVPADIRRVAFMCLFLRPKCGDAYFAFINNLIRKSQQESSCHIDTRMLVICLHTFIQKSERISL